MSESASQQHSHSDAWRPSMLWPATGAVASAVAPLAGCALNTSPLSTNQPVIAIHSQIAERFHLGMSKQAVIETCNANGLHGHESSLRGPREVVGTVRPPGLYCTFAYSDVRWGVLIFSFDKLGTLSEAHYCPQGTSRHDPSTRIQLSGGAS